MWAGQSGKLAQERLAGVLCNEGRGFATAVVSETRPGICGAVSDGDLYAWAEVLGFGVPEGREFGGIGKAFWEMQDVAFHGRVPEFEVVKGAHLLNRLSGCPAVEGDAMGGDEHAGAISAEPAMDEDFPSWLFANKSEEAGDLFVRRWRPAIARQIHETNAEGFRTLAFILNYSMQLGSKVDNCVDAELFEVIEPVVPRLGPAIERIIDLAKIWNSRNRNLLGKCNLRGRGCDGASSTATRGGCG